ncbi:dnaJ homolog subfamily C member 30, mitochondrial [Eurosta solidaginis]|uniref:dnaJ homolog subfamily C member 30, mitochondrial n=1 Tax=Eurosta solidaginis TaxID=178769 RepID=UPI00353142BB
MYNRHYNLMMRGIFSKNGTKYFSTSSSLLSDNYYEALGIGKSSTQGEIKSAYYKLSMQYHPDKNKGCEISAKKFRQITQAYEVLGNYRLRRLYDKGIVHTPGPAYAQQEVYEEEADDPETKFYKSRFKKSKVATEEGRTPIYDFDEWSRSHYGQSFQRRQDGKAKYNRKQELRTQHEYEKQTEILLFGMMGVAMLMLAFFYTDSSLDTPKQRTTHAAAESAEANSKTSSSSTKT